MVSFISFHMKMISFGAPCIKEIFETMMVNLGCISITLSLIGDEDIIMMGERGSLFDFFAAKKLIAFLIYLLLFNFL